MGTVEWSIGTGVAALHGEEIVYVGAGDPTELSHLFWDSLAPVLTASLDVNLPAGWTINASAQVSTGGDSVMEDYDWINPASYDFDDWSDRSQHPDTNLDWYFNGQMFVGHDIAVKEGVTVNLNAGVKYVSVQWAATGGSYVYSSAPGSPRDLTGDFPDDPAITLNQAFPAAMAGLDAEFEHEAWSFGVSAHGGVTFSTEVVDHHWMRTDIGPAGGVFYFPVGSAPVVELGGTAKYAFSDTVSFVLTGTFEQVFTARGDQVVYGLENDGSETFYGIWPDGIGSNFRSATITAGLTGTF